MLKSYWSWSKNKQCIILGFICYLFPRLGYRR